MVTDPNAKIRIRSLFKIFGPKAAAMTDRVREGMSKDELLERHGHVLALKNIDLNIPDRQVQVIMGLSGSGKSTLVRHVNRLNEAASRS